MNAPSREAAPARMLKVGDQAFLDGKAALFASITASITSEPKSGSLKRPSWWEKMLLYDPIVLEDLTGFLKGKGVRIPIERVIGKGKKRVEAEREIVNEEIKPWMVQKWCEENGVCCLWKEGLRGGVRGRY